MIPHLMDQFRRWTSGPSQGPDLHGWPTDHHLRGDAEAAFVREVMADTTLARAEPGGDVIEQLRNALRITASVLDGERKRQAGRPFSGAWSIPDCNFRGTVDDALNLADAALQPASKKLTASTSVPARDSLLAQGCPTKS